jgi:flavin-dependent dehydrogenase
MIPAHLTLEDAGKHIWDVVVLGAGPAGAVAAYQLARDGARTLLVEKRIFPREKVCGACLNMSALATLESVGLGSCVMSLGGVALKNLWLGLGGRSVQFDLPGGLAVSRAQLDLALANAAVDRGVTFLPHTYGTLGTIDKDLRQVVLKQRTRIHTVAARVVLIATGLGPVRSLDHPFVETVPSGLIRVGTGCTLERFPDFYHEKTVFMAIGRGGYVGLVRVGGSHLNIAAALDKSWLRACGSVGTATDRILTEAGFTSVPELRHATWQGTASLTRRTRPIGGERFLLLGDSAEYVGPFTGEGIAQAMLSGKVIAPLVRQGIDCWEPSLPGRWTSLHRRLISQRQTICRGITTLLHHPWLYRTAFNLAAHLPRVTGSMIAHINSRSYY